MNTPPSAINIKKISSINTCSLLRSRSGRNHAMGVGSIAWLRPEQLRRRLQILLYLINSKGQPADPDGSEQLFFYKQTVKKRIWQGSYEIMFSSTEKKIEINQLYSKHCFFYCLFRKKTRFIHIHLHLHNKWTNKKFNRKINFLFSTFKDSNFEEFSVSSD